MKINFVARGSVSVDQAARNLAYSQSLGLPLRPRVNPGPLAIVGGGPSIGDHVEELFDWPGDVWAVNGAYRWCQDNGIIATAFSVDPSPKLAGMIRGARRAMLGSYCDPLVFSTLRSSQVEVFDLGMDAIVSGSTTATAAPHLAAVIGYAPVSFFGCESSWSDKTHEYDREVDQDLENNKILVACNGREFLTTAEYLLQAQYLSAVIRAAPEVFLDRSGGLLAALVVDQEFDIVAGSRHLWETVVKPAIDNATA